MVKDKKSLFEMRKERLEHIVGVDYVGGDEAYKSMMQKDFAIEMNSYKNDIAWMTRTKMKVDLTDEYTWEDNIMSKAIRSGLFDDSEEMIRMLLSVEEDILAKPPKPRGKRKKIKEIDAEAALKKYIDMGKTIEEAEQLVKEDVMRADGYEVCVVCRKYFDPKKAKLIIEEGKCYCAGCYGKVGEKGKPLVIKGVSKMCAYCGKPILVGDSTRWICPPYKSYLTDPECKWYHAPECWDAMMREKG
jgi:hypothetical protein